jgi:hypothetical protein
METLDPRIGCTEDIGHVILSALGLLFIIIKIERKIVDLSRDAQTCGLNCYPQISGAERAS